MRIRLIAAPTVFLGLALGSLNYSGQGDPALLASAGAAESGRASAAASLPNPLPGITIPTTYHLKFNPHFSGSQLNRSVWSTCYPWSNQRVGCTNFSNGEFEWYLASQDHLSNGLLYLTARRKLTAGLTRDGRPKTYACRSGMVTTFPSFKFTYGIVQIVARMPSVRGMWPALWLAAASEKFPPEIDILEHWVRPVRPTGVFYHSVSGQRIDAFPKTGDLAKGWHTFSLVWTRFKLAWFIDGRRVLITRMTPPRHAMYFIANLADARKPSTGGCGGSLIIKSVKVWQR